MPVTAAINREKALDAVDVLNDFLGDFVTGVMVFREYSAQHKSGRLPLELMVGVQRMCLSSIVLAFAKFEEFWKHYKVVVPVEHHQACKTVLKEIRVRKITDFRNQVVGHVWNTETKRPLRHSEVMEALAHVTSPDFGTFLNWVNSPKGNTYPHTVVSVVETVRDAINVAHGIDATEVVGR